MAQNTPCQSSDQIAVADQVSHVAFYSDHLEQIKQNIGKVSLMAKNLICDNMVAISSEQNALSIANYILAMKTEINPSDNYRRENIKLLFIFSKYQQDRPFQTITREDILMFLDSYRRPEATDILHKWIGTYNIYRMHLLRFFKWLYYSDVEVDKRPKPKVVGHPNLICFYIRFWRRATYIMTERLLERNSYDYNNCSANWSLDVL
jgi:hypothetical protein